MSNYELNNPLLKRYWFKTTKKYLEFGVTAYSLEDAKFLVEKAARYFSESYELLEIIENVDVRTLDEGHILPNMGAPNFRGVWYPNLNI